MSLTNWIETFLWLSWMRNFILFSLSTPMTLAHSINQLCLWLGVSVATSHIRMPYFLRLKHVKSICETFCFHFLYPLTTVLRSLFTLCKRNIAAHQRWPFVGRGLDSWMMFDVFCIHVAQLCVIVFAFVWYNVWSNADIDIKAKKISRCIYLRLNYVT